MTTYLVPVTDGIATDADGRQYRLVPVKPQWKMLCAGTEYDTNDEHADLGADVANIYRTMLSAATVDLAGMAVKVPERAPYPYAEYSYEHGWDCCLDALGVK